MPDKRYLKMLDMLEDDYPKEEYPEVYSAMEDLRSSLKEAQEEMSDEEMSDEDMEMSDEEMEDEDEEEEPMMPLMKRRK